MKNRTKTNTIRTTNTASVDNIPSGTIPKAAEIFKVFDSFATAKKERSDAKKMAKIQKAFNRAMRFGRWSDEVITLRGISYGMCYGTPWILELFSSHGYEIVHEDTTGYSDSQRAKFFRRPIRLKRRALRSSTGRIICYLDD